MGKVAERLQRLLLVSAIILLSLSSSKATIFVPFCSPRLDGEISPAEYPSMGHIRLVRFYGLDQFADFYWCWDESHLYIAGYLEDYNLYEDGPAYNRWETWRDDSVEIYLHPDENPLPGELTERSRVIAFTIQGTKWRIDRGTGGSTIGLEGIREDDFGPNGRVKYLYKIYGTLNQGTDRDRGWSFELAIPWEVLGTSPRDGERLRFNIYWVRDDDGGDATPHMEPNGILMDEWTVYRGDRYHPSEWESLILSGAISAPPVFAQSRIEVTPLEGRRVRINFTAPARDGAGNPAYKYELRIAEGEITVNESTWQTMRPYPVRIVPGRSGAEETIEIIGLTPGRTYTVALRALNERGIPSQILSTTFTTPRDDRVFVTVSPHGRSLALTDGSPFTIVPEAAMIPWLNVRGLYDGLIYDPYLERFRNYYQEEGPEGAEAYIEELASKGVNTLLVGVESLDRHVLFETSPGEFNEAVFDFLDRLLAICRRHGIRLLIRIYDTYYYRAHWDMTPWHRLGKSSPDQFFDPDLYSYHERRIAALLNRYKDEPMILGWEILNEVDNADRFNQASLEARRAWLQHMISFARSLDPHHLIFFTFITWDPKDDSSYYRPVLGMDAETAYRLPGVDLSVPHAYYPNIRDPHDATSGPLEMSRGIAYAFYQTPSGRPVLDGESGPSPLYITSYRPDFTSGDDLLFFTRNMWMHFASGGAGAPVRWPGEMFSDTNTISPEMRERLHIFAELVGDIAWDGRRLKIDRAGTDSMVTVTRSDGRHAVSYLLNIHGTACTEIPWLAEPGLWHVRVYSPFNGDLLYEDSTWIEDRLSLPFSTNQDMVILAERDFTLRIYPEAPEYRQGERVRILLDIDPFEGEDVWLWADVNGERFYISSLYPLRIISQPVPMAASLDLPVSVRNFPLLELPGLPPGEYCLGIKVGDRENRSCWEVSQ